MDEGKKTIGTARLLWPLILGLALALGLLWALMPHATVEAQAVNPSLANAPRVSVPPPPQTREDLLLPRTIPSHGWPELRDGSRTIRGAPMFALAGGADGVRSHAAALLTPPLPGSTDLAICMTTDRVWGVVGVENAVTVTVNGTQMGAALSDGNGFFWTTLYDATGNPPDLQAGDQVRLYEDGVQIANATLRSINGQIDLVNDVVSGQIGGTGHPLSVTVYAPWGEPSMTSYSQTVSTDGSGNFTVDFSTVWDFVVGDEATAAYVHSGIEIHQHLYASNSIMVRPSPWNDVMGRAAPGTTVLATVYLADGVTVKASRNLTASLMDGWYRWNVPTDLVESDIVVVALAGGTTMSRTVDTLTMNVDATNDRVTGQAEPGATVRGTTSDLTPLGWRDVQASTTADPTTGVYTLEFGTLADLTPGRWAGIFVADNEGDELNLWNNTPSVDVNQTWNEVSGQGPSPPGPQSEGRVVTLTIYSASSASTSIYTKNMDWYSWYGFTERDDSLPDITPGDVVTVEAEGYAWQGVVEVMTMTIQHDLDADRFTGEVETPTDRVQLSGWQWNGWLYPAGGEFNMPLTATSPFTGTPTGFDVRNGTGYWTAHRTTDDYVENISREADWIEVDPRGNGLEAVLYPPGTAYTVTLYDGSGSQKAQSTGTSNDPIGHTGWRDFWWSDEHIMPDDRVQVQSAAGFSQTVKVPAMTINADADADFISGQGPANALLFVDVEDQGQGFVPTDASGQFAMAVEQLQNAGGDGDLQRGDWIGVWYFDENNNRVRSSFRWPEMRVNYGHGWVGADYPADHTFWITVTDSGGGVKATAAMSTAYGGGWSADGFQTDWDDWSPTDLDIEPGDRVYGRTDDGYSNVIHVGTITGAVDVDNDSVGGNVYATWFTQMLDVECHAWGAPGGAPNKESTAAPDGSVPYLCQWDPVTEWDILPGQDVAVMYREPDDGDRVMNVFEEPAPDLEVHKWSDGQPAAGSNFAYWIEYENRGEIDATDVVLTDTLPLDTSYVADSSGVPANVNGQVITWSLGTVPVDSQARFLLVVAVAPGASGTLHNEAEIYTLYDGDPWNNSTDRDDDIQPVDVDLGVDKWNESDNPAPGYDFTYRVEYRNHGNTGSGIVTLTDTMPLSTTFVSWYAHDPLWNMVGVVGRQAVFTRPVIPGDSGEELFLTLHLSDTVRQGTTLTNEVDIATTNETGDLGNNSRTHTMDVQDPRLEIGVDKRFNEGTTVADHDISFRVHYRNHSNTPAYGVVLTDTLPAGTTFVTSTIEVWQNGDWRDVPFPPALTTPSHVVWDVGTLDPGEDHDMRVTLHINPGVAAGTVLTNAVDIAPTMIVTYEDDYSPNDHAEASVTVRAPGPNLMIVKDGHWQGGPPWEIEYDLSFYNIGTTRIDTFTITDTYPLSTTFNWGDLWWGDPITFTHNPANRQAIWQVGDSIRPGDNGGGRMTVNVDPSVGRGRILTNVIEVTVPPGDVSTDDNTYVDVQTTGPDLYAVKTAPSPWVEAGETLTFTLRYGNQARRWADQTDQSGTVYVTDTLPAGLEYITSTMRWCGGPDCPYVTPDFVGDHLVFDVGPQGDDGWNEIYLTVRVTDTAQMGDAFTNSVTIASSNPISDIEPYTTNNTDSFTVSLRKYDIYLPLVMRNS